MTIFLILAPFGAYSLLMLVTSATISVFAGAAVCIGTIALDVARGRSIKILAAGSAIVFAGIGIYLMLLKPSISNSAVSLAVDSGVFAISLGSILLRSPFTLQYALEAVPAETAALPGFLRTNYVIAAAWTVAALLMMLANAAVIYVPGLPIWAGILIAFTARNSAVYFTKWYRKTKYSTPRANALPKTH
jgi:hypothetical protein